MNNGLLKTDPVAFVSEFINELGYNVREVDAYRPNRWSRDRRQGRVGEFILTEVDSTGGGEGDGEHMDIVFSISDGTPENTVHFQVRGVYNSWAASEWDNTFDIVEQREVTITKWMSINQGA